MTADKSLTWLTTAFDAFAMGAAMAFGLMLFASEASSQHVLRSAWTCLGVAVLCWTVMIAFATRRRPAWLQWWRVAEQEPLQVSEVRTAEREGQDGVHFCIHRHGGRHEFILARSALARLIDGEFPNKESMLWAFEIYQARIARAAAACLRDGTNGPTLLTSREIDAVPAAANSRL
jgi:hypothetical protein